MKEGKCFSCGIGIGADFIEPLLYPVGAKGLCWWCNELLKERGVLKIVADEEDGKESRVVYLYQDGRIERIRMKVKIPVVRTKNMTGLKRRKYDYTKNN